MAANQDFWGGAYDLGTGMLTSQMAQSEARRRLGAAQGPGYDAANAGAVNALKTAGNMDPNAIAAQRFAQQQQLVAPVEQKQVDDLTRSLYAKGMLGAGTYNPGIEGYTPNGTAVNPQMAALFAAQSAGRNKAAYGAMDEGQTYLNNLLNRSGMLTTQAGNIQRTGLQGQATQPSQATALGQVLKGAGQVFKLPDVMKSVGGLFGKGADWLGNATGWWGGSNNLAQPDFSGGFY